MSRNPGSRLSVVTIATGRTRVVAEADAVGGSWSPNGHRIAYWGVTRDAVRDIWTVPADGSGPGSPVNVTDDAAVDWGPAWSPDARFLYFSSSRGGTMNLWRVAIDEASGRTLGEPEPVMTPTGWSGSIEFSRDGQVLVFAEQDERSSIWAVGFDPDRGEVVGSPRPVLQGRAINSIDLSPDGRRVVFSQRLNPWEALGLVGIDGTGWSRLTDAEFYHRAPTWSPDGERILFYSNRSAKRIFTMLPDGSGFQNLPLAGDLPIAAYPVWSRDESHLALTGPDGLLVFDTTGTPMREAARVPNKPGEWPVLPFSWSPDGRTIAGTSRLSPTRDRLVLVDIASGSVRTVAEDGKSPIWLPDSRRLLYSGRAGVELLDTGSGSSRQILPLRRGVQHWGRLLSLSRDGRTLLYLSSTTEGDIWMMTLGGPDRQGGAERRE